MSLFDLITNDKRASFTDTPDLTTYAAVRPEQSLFALNPALISLKGRAWRDALLSQRMHFDIPIKVQGILTFNYALN